MNSYFDDSAAQKTASTTPGPAAPAAPVVSTVTPAQTPPPITANATPPPAIPAKDELTKEDIDTDLSKLFDGPGKKTEPEITFDKPTVSNTPFTPTTSNAADKPVAPSENKWRDQMPEPKPAATTVDDWSSTTVKSVPASKWPEPPKSTSDNTWPKVSSEIKDESEKNVEKSDEPKWPTKETEKKDEQVKDEPKDDKKPEMSVSTSSGKSLSDTEKKLKDKKDELTKQIDETQKKLDKIDDMLGKISDLRAKEDELMKSIDEI